MDVIDKTVSFLLAMVLVPIAIAFYLNATTTGLSTSELAIWGLLLIFFLLSVAIPYVRSVQKKK